MGTLLEVWPRRALTEAGLDPRVPLERVPSVTNEVWRSDLHVIRVNRDSTRRLLREAHLSRLLPAEVGYPRVVAAGGGRGFDWIISERIHAIPLAWAWPTLDQAQRRRAVSDFAARLRALHSMPQPVGMPQVTAPHLLADGAPRPAEPLFTALIQASARGVIDVGLARQLAAIVSESAASLDPYPTTHLVHGDLTFENMLWDGESVVAIVDLEFCRGAPADLDLDVLLRTCAYPELHVAPDYLNQTHRRDYELVPGWLCEDYPELFAHPRVSDRCRIYSIAYDVSDLLDCPPVSCNVELPRFHVVNRLRRTAAGTDQIGLFTTGITLQ